VRLKTDISIGADNRDMLALTGERFSRREVGRYGSWGTPGASTRFESKTGNLQNKKKGGQAQVTSDQKSLSMKERRSRRVRQRLDKEAIGAQDRPPAETVLEEERGGVNEGCKKPS